MCVPVVFSQSEYTRTLVCVPIVFSQSEYTRTLLCVPVIFYLSEYTLTLLCVPVIFNQYEYTRTLVCVPVVFNLSEYTRTLVCVPVVFNLSEYTRTLVCVPVVFKGCCQAHLTLSSHFFRDMRPPSAIFNLSLWELFLRMIPQAPALCLLSRTLPRGPCETLLPQLPPCPRTQRKRLLLQSQWLLASGCGKWAGDADPLDRVSNSLTGLDRSSDIQKEVLLTHVTPLFVGFQIA